MTSEVERVVHVLCVPVSNADFLTVNLISIFASELDGSCALLFTRDVFGDVPELVEADSIISNAGLTVCVFNILSDSGGTDRADGNLLFSLISVGNPGVSGYNSSSVEYVVDENEDFHGEAEDVLTEVVPVVVADTINIETDRVLSDADD